MKKVILKTVIYLVLSLWALTTIYPFCWVLINSFKTTGQIRMDSFSLPKLYSYQEDGESRLSLSETQYTSPTSNYNLAFERMNIPLAYRNSLIVSGSVTLVVLLLGGFGAFAMARYRFRLQKALYALLVAAMMIPIFATIIPVFRIIYSWNLTNHPLGVILPQIAGNVSFAMIVLISYIRSLPYDIEEAAFLEGCDVFKIFFKVVAPLTKPAFATVAIFTFIWSYNDLFTQLFILRDRRAFTITRLLNEIHSIAGTNYGLMAASVILVVLPVIVLYAFLQKFIIKGMTAGAVKG